MRYRNDFVSNFRTERDQGSGLTVEPKLPAGAPIGKDERASTIRFRSRLLGLTVQKYAHRDTTCFSLDPHETGVAILVSDKEISLPIAQELRRFAASDSSPKMLRDLLATFRDSLGDVFNCI